MPKDRALSRLRSLARSVCDLDRSHPDFDAEFEALKRRADLALKETKLGRGNPTNLIVARKRAVEVRRRASDDYRAMILPSIAKLREEGVTTYREIAAALNAQSIKPPRAEQWTPGSVRAIEVGSPH